MEMHREIVEVRAVVSRARRAGRPIGLVPTMGALHAGHLSLMQASRSDGCTTVVSIFVNPTQFGPREDFARYPRDETGDLEKCRQAGVECVFLPDVKSMFRSRSVTTVQVGKLGDHLCGPFRPGHFVGVATVVAKLFNIVQPDRAYFGEKDAQQLAIIRRMACDLDFPLEVVGCPTLREPDGLAMSSRNSYLTSGQRMQATSIYRALTAARERILAGECDPVVVQLTCRKILDDAGPHRVDYISVVDPEFLQPVDRIAGPVLVAMAIHIGATRLIDNLRVDLPGGAS